MAESDETKVKYNLCTWITKYVKRVINGDCGLCVGRVAIKFPANSFIFPIDRTTGTKNDMFALYIPYAGTHLHWQVMFDGRSKDCMPDFIFDEGFSPDLEDIPHLFNWDPKDKDGLLIAVGELLKIYFTYQLDIVKNTNLALHEQISEIHNSSEFSRVEVLQNEKDGAQYKINCITVQILIQLPVDFQSIPDIHYKDAPPLDTSFQFPVLLLKVTDEKIVPSLYMSPRMEHVLGGQNLFTLPHYTTGAMTLIDYAHAVVRNLQKMIHILVEGHLKRREYIAAMLCQCKSNVLEYDSENFSKISLVFSNQNFFFTFHVSLGRFFPQDQPKVLMQSIYHTTKQGTPYNQRFTSYPYSPRWSGQEMVKRIKSFLLENVDHFKEDSLKKGVII